MSKKILKRSLALGALMAFVITGSAWAGETHKTEVYVNSDREYTGDVFTRDENVKITDASEYAIEHTGGKLTIDGCTIEGINKALQAYNIGSNKAVVSQASVLYSTAGSNNEILISNSVVKDNSNKGKKTSYGIINVAGAKMTVENSTFENNISTNVKGAVIYKTSGTLEIKGSEFSSNKAGDDKGGAISVSGTTLTLRDFFDEENAIFKGNMFTNNEASSWGGAINSEGNSTINLIGVNKFYGNKVTNSAPNDITEGGGGAIGLECPTTNVDNGDILNIEGIATFDGNSAYRGGALFNAIYCTVNVGDFYSDNGVGKTEIVFQNNKATKEGGAIYNTGTLNFGPLSNGNAGGTDENTPTVDVTFSGNTADSSVNDICNSGVVNINRGASVTLDGGISNAIKFKTATYYYNEFIRDGIVNINGGALNLNARQADLANNRCSDICIENIVKNDGTININRNVIAKFDEAIKGSGYINVDGGTLIATLVKDDSTDVANNIVMTNGASWDFSGTVENFVNGLNLSDDSIIKHNSDKNITVTNYSGDGTVEFNSDGHLHIDSGSGTLNLTASDLTTEAIGSLSKKEVADKFNEIAGKLGVKEAAKGIEAKMVVAAGEIVGETTGIVTYSEDEVNGYFHGLVEEENITEKINPANKAISDTGISMKLHWRAHVNDMNKRMGELRDANGEHGVWIRMVRGESEYKNTKAQYNQYQLGYDEKLSVDKRWTVGAAVTFSEGDASYGYGSTEDKSTAFAIYGSKLNNDGTFVDLIARYAHLESDVDDQAGEGSYSANGMSVSAEFGKRIQQGNGLWVEPQVELTYGTIDSAEYKLGTKTVEVGDMDSLIGRVGFRIGKDIEKGNVYARASYLYDFEGETENAFRNDTVRRSFNEDLGGGWWEVGVGANINLSKATYLYADVEKTFGGEVDTNWQWNLGVRYSF